MYYLNSRYYNPGVGRFINADGLIGSQGDILGHNMYAYTQNNPVMYKQRPISSGGSITTLSNSVGGSTGVTKSTSAVKQIAKVLSSSQSSGFNLFGYELRFCWME